jgi:ESF2/ABP1 family protein
MSSQAAGPSVPKRSQKRSRESAFEHDIVTPRLPPLASLDDPVTDHARVRAAVSASDGEKPKRKKSKRKAPTPGIIYISRVPPGMTPQKVRHLMARWGEVGKIYAQKKDGELPELCLPSMHF